MKLFEIVGLIVLFYYAAKAIVEIWNSLERWIIQKKLDKEKRIAQEALREEEKREEPAKLEEIKILEAKMHENSVKSSKIRSAISYNACISKEESLEMKQILEDEVIGLNFLFEIIEQDNLKINRRMKDWKSKVALEAKELCDKRVNNPLKIGFGYTPHYNPSGPCSKIIGSALSEYRRMLNFRAIGLWVETEGHVDSKSA